MGESHQNSATVEEEEDFEAADENFSTLHKHEYSEIPGQLYDEASFSEGGGNGPTSSTSGTDATWETISSEETQSSNRNDQSSRTMKNATNFLRRHILHALKHDISSMSAKLFVARKLLVKSLETSHVSCQKYLIRTAYPAKLRSLVRSNRFAAG